MALRFRNLFIQGLRSPDTVLLYIRYLPKLVRLYLRLFKDPRVPWYLKLMVIGALAYVLSPIDLIPDWLLPLIGQMDDLIVLLAALRLFIRKCPQEVLWEHIKAIESGK